MEVKNPMFKQLVYATFVLLIMGSVSFTVLGHDTDSTLLEDVDKNGIVNIQDLVLVANAFGQPIDPNATQNPDVNQDGIINILDLVRIGNRFGETATATVGNSTYHDIQNYIFDKSCANIACHAAPTNAGNLNLTYELSYQNLVGRTPRNPAAAAAGMKLVDPGNPDNSFILTKLMGPTLPEHGARMPFAAGKLHDGKIEAIQKWIAAGASHDTQLPDIGDLAVLRDPQETFEVPAPPPLGQGYQLHLPPFQIEPGTELEVFYATQLTDENGNPPQEDIFVNGFEIFYPTGSHHFILYRITKSGLARGILQQDVVPGIGVDPQDTFRVVNTETPQEAGHLALLNRLPIIGSQRAETSIQFPEGVALRIAGDTVFDMNSHYINLLGTETIIGETYVNLYTIPPEEVKYEARGLASSNKDINVPPGTTQVASKEWLVDDTLKLLELLGYSDVTELHVFQLTSHMHRHGELFEINRISTGELLHRSVAYDNAPLDLFDPPLIFTSGDGLRYQCTHSNYDKDEPIQYGLTSEDEMCIMFGFYYIPAQNDH